MEKKEEMGWRKSVKERREAERCTGLWCVGAGVERGWRRRGGGREGFNAQISLHHLVQLRGWFERIQRQTIIMIVCGINKVKQTYTDAAMLRLWRKYSRGGGKNSFLGGLFLIFIRMGTSSKHSSSLHMNMIFWWYFKSHDLTDRLLIKYES